MEPGQAGTPRALGCLGCPGPLVSPGQLGPR